MSTENPRLIKHKLLENAPHLLYKLSLEESTKDIVYQVGNKLADNDNLSYLIYFNHLALGDPLFAAHIASMISPNQKRPLVVPTSHYHTNPDAIPRSFLYYLAQAGQWTGIDIVRVIQAYQVDNPEYNYTPEQAAKTAFNFLKHIKNIKQNHPSLGVLISPEGTRKQVGAELGKFEKGIINIGKLMESVVYIPLGIKYPRGYRRKSINLMKPVTLTLGNPIYQSNTQEIPSLDNLFTNLKKVI